MILLRKAIPIIVIICFFTVFVSGNIFLFFNSETIQGDDSLGTIYLISHSHWDPWFHFNYKENMEIAAGNIKGALDTIAIYPDYRYTIDQMEVVRYFWETFPEYREKLMNAIEIILYMYLGFIFWEIILLENIFRVMIISIY